MCKRSQNKSISAYSGLGEELISPAVCLSAVDSEYLGDMGIHLLCRVSEQLLLNALGLVLKEYVTLLFSRENARNADDPRAGPWCTPSACSSAVSLYIFQLDSVPAI